MSYTIARHSDGWVVLQPDGSPTAQRFAPTAKGAQEAQQAAQSLNAAADRPKPEPTPEGMQIRHFRYIHRLTQKALAERLGVERFTLQRWESGESQPPAFLDLALQRLGQLLVGLP